MVESKNRLENFGVGRDMTTDEYISWLGIERGEEFIRSKEYLSKGNYWRLKATKLQLIEYYSKSHEE